MADNTVAIKLPDSELERAGKLIADGFAQGFSSSAPELARALFGSSAAKETAETQKQASDSSQVVQAMGGGGASQLPGMGTIDTLIDSALNSSFVKGTTEFIKTTKEKLTGILKNVDLGDFYESGVDTVFEKLKQGLGQDEADVLHKTLTSLHSGLKNLSDVISDFPQFLAAQQFAKTLDFAQKTVEGMDFTKFEKSVTDMNEALIKANQSYLLNLSGMGDQMNSIDDVLTSSRSSLIELGEALKAPPEEMAKVMAAFDQAGVSFLKAEEDLNSFVMASARAKAELSVADFDIMSAEEQSEAIQKIIKLEESNRSVKEDSIRSMKDYILVSKGMGLEPLEAARAYSTGVRELGLNAEDSMSRLGYLASTAQVSGDTMTQVYGSTSKMVDSLKLFGDNSEAAGESYARLAETLSQTNRLGLVGPLIEKIGAGIANMSDGWRGFMGMMTTSGGAIEGMFEIEQMLEEGRADEVLDMVQQEVERLTGSQVMGRSEAISTGQQDTAYQQRQLLMNMLNVSSQEANRLAEALGGAQSGSRLDASSALMGARSTGEDRRDATTGSLETVENLIASQRAFGESTSEASSLILKSSQVMSESGHDLADVLEVLSGTLVNLFDADSRDQILGKIRGESTIQQQMRVGGEVTEEEVYNQAAGMLEIARTEGDVINKGAAGQLTEAQNQALAGGEDATSSLNRAALESESVLPHLSAVASSLESAATMLQSSKDITVRFESEIIELDLDSNKIKLQMRQIASDAANEAASNSVKAVESNLAGGQE